MFLSYSKKKVEYVEAHNFNDLTSHLIKAQSS